ncbi:M16 family metallopeptidase [Deinococcus maricopensis]|uniref:Peptidase M16 domain protein n=1 Tax=Deinococcus maricopensis (strain DSM 21211 / LMG 22137 / NRRL B-23946 / LB-34) TaxID=709986 RepID=E8U3J7_DEIML|nr:pitrilysin family protein [Deinococcus maricopensis]ADV68621.1 peptidase M16 domain protein [Deinococcus maricopensis DSM 21211]
MPDPHLFALPCGLTLVFEARSGPGFALELRVPVGAAHDQHGREGAAGVLEEWLFKGADGLDARGLADAFDDLGVRRGGGVTAEATRFTLSGLAGDLGEALTLLARVLRAPHLHDDEFDVLVDLAQQDLEGLQDSPADRLALAMRAATFGNGYGHPVSGTPEGLSALTPDDVRDVYARFGAHGAVLALVAPLAPEEARALTQRIFGDWAPGSGARVPVEVREGVRAHIPDDSEQTHMTVCARGIAPRDPDWLAWHLALTVLSGGSASRLFHEVREERGLAYSVSAGAQIIGDAAVLGAYAGTTPDRAQETLDVLRAALAGLRGGVTPEEYMRAREALVSSTVFSSESLRSRAANLARDWWLFGETRTPQQLRAQVEAVTLPQVNAFLDRYDLGPLGVLTLGQEALV